MKTMWKNCSFTAVILAVSALVVGSAAAQDVDVAGAQAMYERGMDALDKGLFDIACPSFAESHRLFPQAGTMFQWANCEDKAGKIASALTRYQLYLNDVKLLPTAKQQAHTARVKEAEARNASLRDEIPTLTVTLVGASREGITVKRDGIELTAVSLGVSIPVDPGEHVVTAELTNGRVIEQRLKVERKEKKVVEIDVAPPPPPPPVVKLPSEEKPRPTDVLLPVAKATNGLRTVGFVVLGVGGAGLVFGGVMGGLALSHKSTVDAECDNAQVCQPRGLEAVTNIVKFGTPSTVGFVAGGVLAATGLVLVLAAPYAKVEGKTSLQVRLDSRPGAAFVTMKGTL